MNANSTDLTKDSLLSKRNLRWAGAAGLATAALCCGLPLIAVVLGGGALASLAGSIRPGTELLVGGVAACVVLGGAGLYARRKNQKTSAQAGKAPAGSMDDAGRSSAGSVRGCCVPGQGRSSEQRSPSTKDGQAT
jgi:hypothetical protein